MSLPFAKDNIARDNTDLCILYLDYEFNCSFYFSVSFLLDYVSTWTFILPPILSCQPSDSVGYSFSSSHSYPHWRLRRRLTLAQLHSLFLFPSRNLNSLNLFTYFFRRFFLSSYLRLPKIIIVFSHRLWSHIQYSHVPSDHSIFLVSSSHYYAFSSYQGSSSTHSFSSFPVLTNTQLFMHILSYPFSTFTTIDLAIDYIGSSLFQILVDRPRPKEPLDLKTFFTLYTIFDIVRVSHVRSLLHTSM